MRTTNALIGSGIRGGWNRCAVVLILLTAGAKPAPAELQPGFSLDYGCDQAVLIAIGKLDGKDNLTGERVLLGDAKGPKQLKIEWNGARLLRTAMRAAPNSSIEVLVFLDKDNRPVLGNAGIVGFANESVYLVDLSRAGGFLGVEIAPTRHATITRARLIEFTQMGIADTAQRRALVAMAPSAQRAQKLLDFLQQQIALDRRLRLPTMWPDYQVREVTRAIAPIQREEEAVLVSSMCDTKDDGWRIRLLNMAAQIPFSNESFEYVANWTGRDQPKQLREAAIGAMARINNEWASERLLPMLCIDDPSCAAILSGLCTQSRHTDYWTRNPKTADALVALMQDLLKRPQTDRKAAQLSNSVLNAVHGNFHPRMLPILIQWSLSNYPTSQNATSTLTAVTALDSARENVIPLNAWWLAGQEVLLKVYDLKTTAGIDEWIDAYQKSQHPTTREMLHRLWLFEREVPEHYLLAQAESSNLERMRAARAALTRLWQWGRLAPETKGAIIDRFVSMQIKESTSPNNTDGARELRVIARRKFAFPKNTWLEYTSDFSLDGCIPKLRPGWSSSDLEGEGDFEVGSLGGGQFFGEPSATAVVALREFDHRNKRVVWSHRWELGPLKLRRIDPSPSASGNAAE